MKISNRHRRYFLRAFDTQEDNRRKARAILRASNRRLSGPESDELRAIANGHAPTVTTYVVKVRGTPKAIEDCMFRRLCTEFAALF